MQYKANGRKDIQTRLSDMFYNPPKANGHLVSPAASSSMQASVQATLVQQL